MEKAMKEEEAQPQPQQDNNWVPLAAFAVVLILLVGLALWLNSPGSNGSQPTGTSSPTPNPFYTAPTSSPKPYVLPGMENAVQTNTVTILYGEFKPSSIKVAAGSNVTWVNADGRIHSVRSSPDSPEQFYSGNLGGGQNWSFEFDTVGTYSYFYDDLTGAAQGSIYVLSYLPTPMPPSPSPSPTPVPGQYLGYSNKSLAALEANCSGGGVVIQGLLRYVPVADRSTLASQFVATDGTNRIPLDNYSTAYKPASVDSTGPTQYAFYGIPSSHTSSGGTCWMELQAMKQIG